MKRHHIPVFYISLALMIVILALDPFDEGRFTTAFGVIFWGAALCFWISGFAYLYHTTKSRWGFISLSLLFFWISFPIFASLSYFSHWLVSRL